MFFIDSLLWVARQVRDAAVQAQENEEDEIKRRLTELYLRLDAGVIGEAEFAVEETRLLDRLDQLAFADDAMLAAGGEPEDIDVSEKEPADGSGEA